MLFSESFCRSSCKSCSPSWDCVQQLAYNWLWLCCKWGAAPKVRDKLNYNGEEQEEIHWPPEFGLLVVSVSKWIYLFCQLGGGWGCEVSCGGHHRLRGRKTTTGSALDGAVFDIAQILAYLVHNMSRSQLYLGFDHFGWLPSFFGQ